LITSFNTDERIIEGIHDLIIDSFNDTIDAHNLEYDDENLLSYISEDNLYSDYVTVQQLMDSVFRFPAIAFYIDRTGELQKNNAIYFNNTEVRFAIFTEGANGATIIKRYLSALRDLLNTNYKDIDACVFKLDNQRWRYFTPIKYNSEELRIAELEVQITVEVRR
jgi:hypothetical protein